MQRRLVVASLLVVLALAASPASAQLLKLKFNNDSNVRPASCHTADSGCAGGACISGACSCAAGDCSAGHLGDIGPCGPGGCATGDCLPRCYSAPYTNSLYPNCCYGPCGQANCCKTIFGEMAMDIRRLWLGRGLCGFGACGGSGLSGSGLLGGGLLGRNFQSGMGLGLLGGPLSNLGCSTSCSDDTVTESSCGCETAGCAGDCAAEPTWTEPVLDSSRGCESAGCSDEICCECESTGGPGGLFGGIFTRSGRYETAGCSGEISCGCESVGCVGGLAGGGILETSCGCETAGCSGDCTSGVFPQDVLSPCCRGRGVLGSIGGLLFGNACECGSCTGADNCSIEISCGVEDAGCASTLKQPGDRLVSAEQPLRSRILAKSVNRKSMRTQAAPQPRQRDICFAKAPKASKAENAIKWVRHDQPTGQPDQRMNEND